MSRFSYSLAVVALTSAVSISQATAADTVAYVAPDGGLTVMGGIGYAFLRGDEIVYDEAGDRISHLIWESNAPVFTASVKGEIKNNWTFSGNARIGGLGDSHMEDYDWFQGNYAWDNWTHRSVHPDTKLHRYIDLDIAIGRDMPLNEATVFNLHGGFKYTNVKWTGYGGTYVYSTEEGFRDDIGKFPSGERGISFEQRYPGLFLGGETSTKFGAWTFSGLARGGFTIDASDTDHHWMRNLRFEEGYGPIGFVSLGGRVDYAMNGKASLFLAGNYDQYFHRKGDSTIYDIQTGENGGTSKDAAGMEFRAFTLSAGVKASF